MRITVECGAFDEAADAVRTANQVCAIAAEALSARLIRSGGMAGNDSTSAEFAAAYDAGAREAVHALASLSSALVGLGRLVAATGQRHRRAEASAAGEVLGSVSAALASEAWTRSDLRDPPSSLGAQEPTLGQVDRWILDHVEGFVWPGADVDALRGVATSWRRASESVAGLSDHLTAARALLATQRSPELVTALACIDDMDSMIIDTAAELAALGSACDEHASAVEEVHHRTRALLTEVASMAVEGVAISVILTGLSGGLGGGVGLGTLLARLRTVAPRFHALLASLRVSVAVSASRLRTGRETLSGLRVRLERYARAQVRDERGSVGWGRGPRDLARRIHDPLTFDPEDLRGLPSGQIRQLLDRWDHSPSRSGVGDRFSDPLHPGRQIRLMDGYPGNRPDPITHGPYAVVSQNGARPVKIPLEGNPTL